MITGLEKVLLLSPHSDDIELAMGATISKLIRYNVKVSIAIFSFGLDRKSLEKEFNKSMNIFRIRNIYKHIFPVREFNKYRQNILSHLVEFNKSKFDIIFCPSEFDKHQDHKIIYDESMRAFKNSSIICYESDWNNLGFISNAFVEIEQEDFDKKMKSLSCYESQKDKKYFSLEYQKGLASTRGIKSRNSNYAEAFYIKKLNL